MAEVQSSAVFVVRAFHRHWLKLALVAVGVLIGSYVILGTLNRQTYEAHALIVLDRSSNKPGHSFPLSVNDYRAEVERIAREHPDLTALSDGRREFSTGVVSRSGGFPVLSLRVFDSDEERALESVSAWLAAAVEEGVEVATQEYTRAKVGVEEQYAEAEQNAVAAKTEVVAFLDERRQLAGEIESSWDRRSREVRIQQAAELEKILVDHKKRLREVASTTCDTGSPGHHQIEPEVRRIVSLYAATMDSSLVGTGDPSLSINPAMTVTERVSDLRESLCIAAPACCDLPEALDGVLGEARLAAEKLLIEKRYQRRSLNRQADDALAKHRDMTSQLALPLNQALDASRAEFEAVSRRLSELRAEAPAPEEMVRVHQEPVVVKRLSHLKRVLLAGLAAGLAALMFFLGALLWTDRG